MIGKGEREEKNLHILTALGKHDPTYATVVLR